ncbi:hypothetical protein, partial [Acinetobacter baumannii]|uniref:hypothetical protein n=1 Tax=Acinetobacter baumannii TaxID=470 RepID=UPI001C07D22D
KKAIKINKNYIFAPNTIILYRMITLGSAMKILSKKHRLTFERVNECIFPMKNNKIDKNYIFAPNTTILYRTIALGSAMKLMSIKHRLTFERVKPRNGHLDQQSSLDTIFSLFTA